jgi:SAM-dependent methyltransferase
MTEDEQPVNTDPALIMNQIRMRVLETANRRGAEDRPMLSRPEDTETGSLREITSEWFGSPRWNEALATSYPFPLKPLALRIRRMIREEIRSTMETYVQAQMRFNAQTTVAIRSARDAIAQMNSMNEEQRNLKSQMNSLNEELRKLRDTGQRMQTLFFNYPVHVSGNKCSVNERIVEDAFVLHNVPRWAKRVLDIGCAESYLSIHLASLGFSVYGIDTRDYNLSHQNFHFIRDDIACTPFPDKFFDAVVAVSTLEHVGLGHYRDPKYPEGDSKAIREIHRVLKKKGRLIMSVPFAGKATTTWQRIYDAESLSRLLRGLKILEKLCWIKCDEEWRSATFHEAAMRRVLRPSPANPYPLADAIAVVVATKKT